MLGYPLSSTDRCEAKYHSFWHNEIAKAIRKTATTSEKHFFVLQISFYTRLPNIDSFLNAHFFLNIKNDL